MSNCAKIKQDKVVCRHCGGKNLQSLIEGESEICLDCSAVVAFAQNDTREGARESVKTKGSSSMIIENIKVSDATEKNLAIACSCIVKASQDLGISKDILMEALSLYKIAVEKKLTRRGSIRSFCAGTLYIASKRHNSPRSFFELATTFNVNRNAVFTAYRILHRELNVQVSQLRLHDYFAQLLSVVRLDPTTEELTAHILALAEQKKFHLGRNPRGIIAAAIYLAAIKSGKRITQRELSRLIDVTEVTIRANCNRLREL